MGYAKIGLNERPSGRYLVDICQSLIDAGGGQGWEARLASALSGQGSPIRDNRFLNSIHPLELLTLSGNPNYAAGSTAMRRLQHLLLTIFQNLGLSKRRPAALEYRSNPHLNMDEIVDRILSDQISLPLITELGGDSARWANLVALLPSVIRKVAFLRRQRIAYSQRLRRRAQAVGWSILTGKAISQEEKTLFLLVAPGSKRAWLEEEITLGLHIIGTLYPAENNDRLVDEAFTAYCSSVGVGPVSKYVCMFTRRRGDRSTFYVGAPTGALRFASGYLERYGPFVSYEVSEVATFPWTAESQATAAMERQLDVEGKDAVLFETRFPIQAAAGIDYDVLTSLDEDDFELSYYVADPTAIPELSAFDVSYFCRKADRLTSTRTGTFPGGLIRLFDLAFAGESSSEGDGSKLVLQDFDLIDLDECVGIDLNPTVDRGGPTIYGKTEWKFPVLYPDGQVIRESYEDFGPLYYRQGTLLLLPGGREQVMIPKAWLFEDDDVALKYASGLLHFSPQEFALTKASLSCSFNVQKYRKLLPLGALPAFSPELVARAHLS